MSEPLSSLLTSWETSESTESEMSQAPSSVPSTLPKAVLFPHPDRFESRHNGPREADVDKMALLLGYESLEEFISATVPDAIRLKRPLRIEAARSEHEALADLKAIANKNKVFRSFIGMGYSNCITPPVILRNILENPAWYTQYTPYQPEISQGRLEALLNFQTMVMDLTGMEIANASLLDEGTAAAEAMSMSFGVTKTKSQDRKSVV